jgi:hypothetical protein
MKQVAGIIAREARQHDRGLPEEEARVFAAFLVVATLGWRLFHPIALAISSVDHTAVDAEAIVTRWLNLMADLAVRGLPVTAGPESVDLAAGSPPVGAQ